MSTTEEDTAAQLLAQLHQYFRTHPVTGPAGHSYISSEPRATAVNPGAPIDLTVIAHIDASVRELADYTREANPSAEPLPTRVEAVYAWCVENTQNAPEDIQQRRDTIIYRQKLESAIAAGHHDVVRKAVRPIRCPACNTFGLFWKPEVGKAVCTNGRCLTKDGLSHRWSLARIATAHIEAQQKISQVRAT
jgi:hypothetical protein